MLCFCRGFCHTHLFKPCSERFELLTLIALLALLLVRRYVKPGGILMLSGILYEQATEIQAAYGGEFQDFVVKTDQQWAVITAVKQR